VATMNPDCGLSRIGKRAILRRLPEWRVSPYVFSTPMSALSLSNPACGCARIPVLETEASSAFPGNGILPGVARGSNRCWQCLLYSIAALGRRDYFLYFSATGRYILPAPCFSSSSALRSSVPHSQGCRTDEDRDRDLRWAIVVSVVLTFSSISLLHRGFASFPTSPSG